MAGRRPAKADDRLTAMDFKMANLVLNGMGVCEAAIECGYSEKSPQTAANRILGKPAVKAYMENQRLLMSEKIRQETEVDDIWITKKFKEILDRCMQARPLMERDPDGGMRQARDEDTGELLFTFDSAGAIKAAENLAKHIGYYEIDNKQKQTVIQVGCVNNQQNILSFFTDEQEPQKEIGIDGAISQLENKD